MISRSLNFKNLKTIVLIAVSMRAFCCVHAKGVLTFFALVLLAALVPPSAGLKIQPSTALPTIVKTESELSAERIVAPVKADGPSPQACWGDADRAHAAAAKGDAAAADPGQRAGAQQHARAARR